MYPRFIERRLREALSDTRVVTVVGPRQAGKTTLAKQIAGHGSTFLTLDDETTLKAAKSDPIGFIRGLDRAVIDEIQRAPDLLLAIKASVDTDPRPGRFLLTGSANLMMLPRVADSLAGRMEIVPLLPLAQAEIQGTPCTFIDDLFAGNVARPTRVLEGDELVHTVLSGGYPEALARHRPLRRQRWYLDYIDAIVQRDVRDVAQIDQLRLLPKLLRVLAEHSSQIVNYSGFSAPLGMNHVTAQKYVGVLQNLFLITTLQPWYSNRLKRLIKTPKIHFLDSGLLAALRDLSLEQIRYDRTPLGPVLETYVLGELLKHASWSNGRYNFFHYRDKDRNEVDIVIEDQRSRVVGIEVKAAATVSASDFAGMRRLSEATGERFVHGIVLYDHNQLVPFGEKLSAVPLSTLWS